MSAILAVNEAEANVLPACCVYVVGGLDNLVKIGFTNNTNHRLHGIQHNLRQRGIFDVNLYLIGAVWAPYEVALRLEKLCHENFRSFHVGSEWFEVDSQEALSFIKASFEKFHQKGNTQ